MSNLEKAKKRFHEAHQRQHVSRKKYPKKKTAAQELAEEAAVADAVQRELRQQFYARQTQQAD